MIFGSLKSSGKLEKFLKEAPVALREEIFTELILGANDIRSRAIKSIQTQKGEPAKRYNPERNVKVSKPGDPPNTDTGRLVQSIQLEVNRSDMSVLVGTNLKYGPWLEFGTKDMAARPWLQPAYLSQEKKISKAVIKTIDGFLKK